MPSFGKYLFIAAALSMLPGCATVFRDTDQKVRFESIPSGAFVQTYRNGTCVTPCSLHFHRKRSFTVSLEKPGYEPQVVRIDPIARRWGVVSLWGDLIPFTAQTDLMTGAYKGFYLDPVQVTLRPYANGESAPRVHKSDISPALKEGEYLEIN